RKIRSKIPPASPAATRLQNSWSNTLGCLAIDSLSDLPDSTSPLTLPRIPPKCLFSACPDSMSRHCTIGRPASTMVENVRVNTTKSLSDTPEPSVGSLISTGFFLTLLMTRPCALRRSRTASSLSASMVPERCSPARVDASQIQAAMLVLVGRLGLVLAALAGDVREALALLQHR